MEQSERVLGRKGGVNGVWVVTSVQWLSLVYGFVSHACSGDVLSHTPPGGRLADARETSVFALP